MILLKIKKLIIYALAHISLSLMWIYFLELAGRVKHLFLFVINRSFVNPKLDANMFMSIIFVVVSIAVYKANSQGLQNFFYGHGVVFSQGMRQLSPGELAAMYALITLSALLMAFFRGPLVFVGYFLAFVTYVVFVSFEIPVDSAEQSVFFDRSLQTTLYHT